jgi:hypothetical protein
MDRPKLGLRGSGVRKTTLTTYADVGLTVGAVRVMYYPAGFVSMGAFGAAVALPHNGVLWLLARPMLNAARALFGLYLLATLMLLIAVKVMRFRRPLTSDPVRARL